MDKTIPISDIYISDLLLILSEYGHFNGNVTALTEFIIDTREKFSQDHAQNQSQEKTSHKSTANKYIKAWLTGKSKPARKSLTTTMVTYFFEYLSKTRPYSSLALSDLLRILSDHQFDVSPYPLVNTMNAETELRNKEEIQNDETYDRLINDLVSHAFENPTAPPHCINLISKTQHQEFASAPVSATHLENTLNELPLSEIFIKPEHFIFPDTWLEHLYKNAFIESRVHAISGERGIGKTNLARFFTQCCISDSLNRKDLKFKHVIFTRYQEQGLKETISLLSHSNKTADQDAYRANINLLSSMENPALIIIDNSDNETSYKTEVSEYAAIYTDLRHSGCHILFTSKVDLSSCYGVYQTKLTHLPLNSLLTLFSELADDCEEQCDPGLLTELIEKYLRSNTYLVRLAAKLTQTTTVQNIINNFEAMNIGSIDDPLDGKDNYEVSLMEHYKLLFNLSLMSQSPEKCHLLYCLMLLPLDGMSYDDFFNKAFKPASKTSFKKTFKSLHETFWVMLVNRQIYLHPMIREMLTQQPFPFKEEYITNYIETLNTSLNVSRYSFNLINDLKSGINACNVIEKLGICNFDIALLFSNIASVYDLFADTENLYCYSKKALNMLHSLNKSSLNSLQLTQLARAYNMVGYTILHAYNKTDSLPLSENALYQADSIIKDLNIETAEMKKLYTINQGDIAALFIVKKDYNKALKIHTKNRRFREHLLKQENTKENQRLLAASYKGIGTVYYYLSEKYTVHTKELLIKSYENQSLATYWYEQVYFPNYHLDIAISYNRKIGTAIKLASFLDSKEKRKVAVDSIEQLTRAITYLCSMQPPNLAELNNAVKNLLQLAKILQSIGLLENSIIKQLLISAQTITPISPELNTYIINYVNSI